MNSFRGARVAIYARYSTDKQSEQSVADQIARCRAFVEERDGRVEESLVYADERVSGASLQRPAMRLLLAAVGEKQIDVVVTESLDRVSRRQADAHMLLDRLAFAGVTLVGVADAIDTSARSSKLLYSVRSMLADAYLDDLADKTLRGMKGRARAGLATGGLPFGYRSVPRDEGGRAIEVDTEQAAIVCRIFREYGSGSSYAKIATGLNRDQIPPPRASRKRRVAGWAASAVRAMLLNEKYVGVWRFGRRKWVKVPGTNKRRPRPADPSDIVTLDRPELRIVDAETWQAVRARLATVGPKSNGASPRGSGRRRYLLSGLLHCAECGGVLAVHGGDKHRRYYGCAASKRRGVCGNRLNVREDAVREAVVAAIRDRFTSPAGLAAMREIVGEGIRDASRCADAELEERGARLERTQERIRNLILMQADGDRSEFTVSARQDLESAARTERAAIEALEWRARRPMVLPSVEELLREALDIEASFAADVETAREKLRRMLPSDGIVMTPQLETRTYRANFALLPLQGLEMTTPPRESSGRRTFDSLSCGGRI